MNNILIFRVFAAECLPRSLAVWRVLESIPRLATTKI